MTGRLQRTGRLMRTVRHLRPSQIAWRLWYRLRPSPAASRHPAPQRRTLSGTPGEGLRRVSLEPGGGFTFLGETRHFDGGIDWIDSRRGKLWTYNLHYFDYLDEAERQGDGHARALIADWIEANQYATGDGWEPYPCSLRIVNWIRWFWRTDSADTHALDSLALQVRWLTRNVEHHILANHLFTNVKALLYAGLFFGGPEGDRWLAHGLRTMTRELDEQILPDGGHFERSPMYQATILNDVLDLIELGGATSAVASTTLARWRDTARAMLDWLATMTHPDGDIAFFNDAAIGIAPSTAELAHRATRLGVVASDPPTAATIHLDPSGYVRAHRGAVTLIADLAPVGPDHQPGHTHADTLSFELSIGSRRVIVNSGTSTYRPGAVRDEQRRTRSHSTLEVDGTDSSETWSGFRVGRRARVHDVLVHDHEGASSLEGAHDGYRHLPGDVVHRRHWRLDAERLVVVDELEGHWRSAIARYFLHPDVTARPDGQLIVDGQPVARWSLEGGHGTIVPARWYPRFGRQRENLCLEVTPRAARLQFELRFTNATHA